MGDKSLARLSVLMIGLALAACTTAPTAAPTAQVAQVTTPPETSPPADAATTTPPPTEAGVVPVITSPAHGSLIIGETMTLEGTGEPGSVVRITDGGSVVGIATVDADGHWGGITVSVTLGRRYYLFVTDMNTEAHSGPVQVLSVTADEATQRSIIPTTGRFSPQIVFAESPTAEPAGIYTTDTKEIFALITYENMAQGMIMRREWLLNDTLWIEKEEPWDFAKYGASGVITDISIHDVNGLPEGRYQLLLYIDGQQQTSLRSGSGNVFSIRHKPALWVNPITSPDGKSVLSVQPPGRIVIRQGGGAAKTLVEADWIYEAAWFPDSTHFVYTNLIGEPDSIWLGIEHNIHVVNVADGTSWAIEYPDNDIPLRELQLSPDGKALFVIAGVAYGDAEGSGGPFGMFIVLDDALKVSDTFFLSDFSGLAWDTCSDRYVAGASVYNQPTFEGEWSGNSTFNLKMQVTCGSQDLSGMYVFNLDTMSTARSGP